MVMTVEEMTMFLRSPRAVSSGSLQDDDIAGNQEIGFYPGERAVPDYFSQWGGHLAQRLQGFLRVVLLGDGDDGVDDDD